VFDFMTANNNARQLRVITNSTERSRLCRQRYRAGHIVLQVDVEFDGLCDLLKAGDLICERDTSDLKAIRCGLEKLITTLIADTRKPNI
jgi:hypothetical protein